MILVTGGAGYIGSHCALRLMESGEDVVVFDSMELGTRHALDVLAREFPDSSPPTPRSPNPCATPAGTTRTTWAAP